MWGRKHHSLVNNRTCSRQPGRSPMLTFFGLEHMVDAAQRLGWGGVGSG